MNRFFLRLVAGSLAATPAHRAVSTAAAAQSEKAPMMVSFGELKWRDLPERKGTQFAALSGDPRVGPYTQMRRVPAGTDNPLHAHSSEITNVVISGVLYTGATDDHIRDFTTDRKSTRLNSSHLGISYAVFCLKKKKK